MARPMKEGVDYFPLDVCTDVKFELLEAKFGIIGFGIMIKLFQRIYAENGYYCKWDSDTALIMAAKNSCPDYTFTIEKVQGIVDEAIHRGIFDKDMYKQQGILTSKGIQKRFFEATKRRSRVDVKENYLLIDISELSENVYINGVNVNKNSKKDNDNTQSKVKETKLNQSISNKSTEIKIAVPQSIIDTYQNNIAPLTPIVLHSIENWLKDMDADVIEWAIKEAACHNKRNFKYIEGILRNHFNAGRTTFAAVQDAKRTFKNQSVETSVYKDDSLDYDELEKLMQEKM